MRTPTGVTVIGYTDLPSRLPTQVRLLLFPPSPLWCPDDRSRSDTHPPSIYLSFYLSLSLFLSQSSSLYSNNIVKFLLSMGPFTRQVIIPPIHMSYPDVLSLPTIHHTSRLISTHNYNPFLHLLHQVKSEFAIDHKDEAVRGALILEKGTLSWPPPPPAAPSAAQVEAAKKQAAEKAAAAAAAAEAAAAPKVYTASSTAL